MGRSFFYINQKYILLFCILILLFWILLCCVSIKNIDRFDNNDSIDNNVSIILTTTIFINKKIHSIAQHDMSERKEYYINSIKNWLEKTNLNVIVVENSGYNYPELNEEKKKYNSRFEIISFKESDIEDAKYLENYDDKGAHEFYAIDYAIKYSQIIKKSNFIFKITGRYYIPEFENFIMKQDLNKYIAARQNNNNRCEIVGSNINNISMIFDRNLVDKNIWAEEIWKNRIERIPKDKVLILPVFKIENIKTGSTNNVVNEL